jgi:hypothetical protein
MALDQRRWICHKSQCRQLSKLKKGLYVETFFEEARSPRKTIFLLFYLWAQQYRTFEKMVFETKISQD